MTDPHHPSSSAPNPPTPTPSAPHPSASSDLPSMVGSRVSQEAFASTSSVEGAADLSGLLARLMEDDAPRWMVIKDRLDHGPFTAQELVGMILKGVVRKQHRVTNMDSGISLGLDEWEEFQSFAEQAEIHLRKQAEREALDASERTEKVSNVVKASIAAAIAVVLVGSGIVVWITRQDSSGSKTAEASLADLYERGEIDVTGSAGILPSPEEGASGRRTRSGSRAAGQGGGSYEDAMNQVINLGDASGNGSMRQLSSDQVAKTMNKHIQQFLACVGSELRDGGTLGSVNIDLAIAGSGKVLGASVRQGSPAFQSCVAAKARGVSFPSFSAPRMGARYAFNVGR